MIRDVLPDDVMAVTFDELDLDDAAALAAFWHGFAADRIAERTGPSGLLAGDLSRELPEAGRALRAAAAAPISGARLALAFPEP